LIAIRKRATAVCFIETTDCSREATWECRDKRILPVRKAGKTRDEARETLLGWGEAFPSDIRTSHSGGRRSGDGPSIEYSGCGYPVDRLAGRMSTTRVGKLQDGFTWGGVSVVNPFTAELHPLLEALLSR